MNPGVSDPSSSTACAPREAEDHRPLAGAVRAVSLVTLLSRIAGLVRNVVVARIFGDTAVGSAFAAAFQTPNMFRRLFGEGALSAAFIPAYTTARRGDEADPRAGAGGGERRADALASWTILALGVATTTLTALIELVLLALLLFMDHSPERALSLRLIMVMLPFMPLICAAAILAGMLQVHGRFAWSSSGPLVLNAFVVGAGLYFMLTGNVGGEATAYALAAATTLSGLTQVLFFLRLLRPHARWTRTFEPARAEAAVMLRRFVPVAIGMGTIQLNAFVDMLIAMWPTWIGPTVAGAPYPLDKASNAILFNTQQIYQFPLGVFGIAVATAVFPLLSRHAQHAGDFLLTLRRGLRLSLLIGIPASVGLVLVRHDITGVLYGHGGNSFSADGVARAAMVLGAFAPGVWAYSLNHVLTRAFYAKGDTRTPMRVSIAMVALNLALNVTLIWPLREAGLALATTMTATLQCLVLARLARRLTGGQVVTDSGVIVTGARIVLAAAVMCAAVLAAQWAMGERDSWAWQLLRVVCAAGAGGAVFFGAAAALRIRELGWLLGTRGEPAFAGRGGA
jgi:putative peptidoglycan lipid II flippase